MRARGSRNWALLMMLAVATAACGGARTESPEATRGSEGNGGRGGDAPPETLELDHEYRYVVPEDATGPVRFTFQVPPGSIVQVDGAADAGNRSAIVLQPTPPVGLNLGIGLEPGQSRSTRPWIHSGSGGGRWVLEIAGSPGDAVTFTVNAPLQADAGGSGDAGGHAGTAVAIEHEQVLSGLLGDEDDQDWYAIPLEGGDVVSLSLEVPPTEEGSVSASIVYNGSPLASTQARAGGTSSLTQVFAQEQTGTAQLRVTGTGAYEFSVEVGPQRDGGSDGDAGGSIADAKPVDFGSFEGVIGGEDTDDFYAMTLPLDAVFRMQVTLAPDSIAGARVQVNYNGRDIINRSVAAGATEKFLNGLVNAADAKAYLRVFGQAGSYSVTIAATTQPDGDGNGDAGGERAQANAVEPTGSFEGILDNRGSDNRDWYRFEATADGTLTMQITVDPEGDRQTRMLVYDGNRRLGDVSVGAGGSNTVSFEVTAGKVYEFEVGAGGLAPYTISFEAT